MLADIGIKLEYVRSFTASLGGLCGARIRRGRGGAGLSRRLCLGHWSWSWPKQALSTSLGIDNLEDRVSALRVVVSSCLASWTFWFLVTHSISLGSLAGLTEYFSNSFFCLIVLIGTAALLPRRIVCGVGKQRSSY